MHNVIDQIEVYTIIRSTMNNLEEMADDVQAMRDELYKFLDKHYDFSNAELVTKLKVISFREKS